MYIPFCRVMGAPRITMGNTGRTLSVTPLSSANLSARSKLIAV